MTCRNFSAQLNRKLIDCIGYLWQDLGSRGEEEGRAAVATSVGEGKRLSCASPSQLWLAAQQLPKGTAVPGGPIPQQELHEQAVAHGGPTPEHRKRVKRKEEQRKE